MQNNEYLHELEKQRMEQERMSHLINLAIIAHATRPSFFARFFGLLWQLALCGAIVFLVLLMLILTFM